MKGFYTQAVAILFTGEIGVKQIEKCLSRYKIVKLVAASDNWEFGGESLVVEYKPEVNSLILIDVVNQRWPDHMGDPKEEPTLFSTWSMGHFGPFVYPYNLKRAYEQSWRWENSKEVVANHNSFVRIRLSYIFGAGEDTPVMPKDNDPIEELKFITEAANSILKHPASLCYFNPSGEVLLSKRMLADSISFNDNNNLPWFDIWSNVRLFKLDDNWTLMDCVGNWQLDIPDQEVAFPTGEFSPEEVDNFIRNVSWYLIENGMVIKDGNTIDGPGNIRFQCSIFENGICDPPREILRWMPQKAKNIPENLLKVESKDKKVKKRKWKFW